MRLVTKTTLFVLLWGAGILFGLQALWTHQMTPGVAAPANQYWPVASRVARDANRAILVLFAHPQCPCTQATLEELGQVLTQCAGLVQTQVLFVRPKDAPQNWERSDVWQKAASLPGVSVRPDFDGVEAHRFGALTSGHSFLYNAQGELLFSGGITGSRGHLGENAGRNTVIALLQGKPVETMHSPVFGCALFGADSR